MRKPSRSTLIAAAIVAGVLALALAFAPGRPAQASGEEGSARVRVRVEALVARSLAREVRAGGFVRARRDVTLFAERAGRVVDLPIPEGGRARAGDLVARLDATIPRARLAEARVAAREAALNPDTAAAELARLDAALRVAEHELALHQPAAPFDGVVEKHHVDRHEFVAAGHPLLDLVDPRELELLVEVDAEIVAAVPLGTDVSIQGLADGGAGGGRGRVTRVAGRAESRTHRFSVEIALSDPGASLRPGSYAEASIPLPPSAPAVYVQKASARREGGDRGVFVEREGRANWIWARFEEVPARPDLLRVVDGPLRDGDRVIVAGFQGLLDGRAVEVEQ